MAKFAQFALKWTTKAVIAAAAVYMGHSAANATPTTLTFTDPSNYSGGTTEPDGTYLPNTYTESGFTFTVPNGANNHFDPFTGTSCDTMGVMCWHDGFANTIADNVLTLSMLSGGAFDLIQLDFTNQRNPTDLIVTSSAGDTMTINTGLNIAFGWTGITYVNFDIPGSTGSSTIPSLDNIVVAAAVPEPATLALFGLGVLGVGLGARLRR